MKEGFMKILKMATIIISMMSCCGCVLIKEVSPEPRGKVAICHKDKKTIYVDEAAVGAHLKHGDYVGVCQ